MVTTLEAVLPNLNFVVRTAAVVCNSGMNLPFCVQFNWRCYKYFMDIKRNEENFHIHSSRAFAFWPKENRRVMTVYDFGLIASQPGPVVVDPRRERGEENYEGWKWAHLVDLFQSDSTLSREHSSGNEVVGGWLDIQSIYCWRIIYLQYETRAAVGHILNTTAATGQEEARN